MQVVLSGFDKDKCRSLLYLLVAKTGFENDSSLILFVFIFDHSLLGVNPFAANL